MIKATQVISKTTAKAKWVFIVPVLLGVICANVMAAADDSGDFTLTIRNGKAVTLVKLINRDVSQPIIGEIAYDEYTGVYNKEKGAYQFTDVPAGMYDILITTDDGTIEGVNLDKYDIIGNLVTYEEELSDADIEKIKTIVQKMKTYENKKRILYLKGGDGYAKALVELLRDVPFYGSHDEVTWRVELWEFEKSYGVWRRLQHFEVLRRFRMQKADFDAMQWIFEPQLGGIIIEKGKPQTLTYTLPDSFDTSQGKVKE